MGHLPFAAGFQNMQNTAQIDLAIQKRILYRNRHHRLRCQMDDCRKMMPGKDIFHHIPIPHITDNQFHPGWNMFPAPIGQIIQDNDFDVLSRLFTYFLQFFQYIGTDKPGPARHKYVHGYTPLKFNGCFVLIYQNLNVSFRPRHV